MKVVFFMPQMPEGQYSSIMEEYNVIASPGIEAGFYMDLSARAIDAVESMKRSNFQSWFLFILYFKFWILAWHKLHQV